MTNKNIFAEGWLYADNQLFATRELQKPINESEILDNLKGKYGIYDIPLLKRVSLIITINLVSLIIAGFVLKTIYSFYSELIEKITINMIVLMFMLFIMLAALYACLLLAFRLCFPRTKRIDTAWSLLNHGIILDGYIVDRNALSVHRVEVTYQFKSLTNQLIEGKYQYEIFPANLHVYFQGKTDNPDSLGHSSPHPHPKHVKIWYANDKLHTLL